MPTPHAIFGLGVPELLIILAVVLLLFGGSRLAGLGKSTGRALKEFKQETKGLKDEKDDTAEVAAAETPTPPTAHQLPPTYEQPPTHQQSQAYQQPPTAPSPNPDGGEIRKDS